MAAQEDLAVLTDALARALSGVSHARVAYLFGSRARGTARPDSDLDVAVKLVSGLDDAARGQATLDIFEAISAELGSVGERADLVDLERAGPAVAFRAIRDGICVLQRDRAERVRLEAFIARRYDDERPHRELARRAAVAAAKRMAAERA